MVRIGKNGSVKIPKKFENLLGWEDNIEITFEVQGKSLIVKKKNP